MSSDTPETTYHANRLTREATPLTYLIIADLIHSDERLIDIAQRRGVSRQRVHQIHTACIDAGIYKRRRIYQ
jgi:hypothetical protein